MLDLLQRLNKTGITVVLVTHEHDIAACARRVVRMRDGRIQSDTTVHARIDAGRALAALPTRDEEEGIA